jgi:hypothetical protein
LNVVKKKTGKEQWIVEQIQGNKEIRKWGNGDMGKWGLILIMILPGDTILIKSYKYSY